MKYCIDKAGKYLGGFDGVEPPADAVEIPQPPEHGADIWTGSSWDKSGRPGPRADRKKEALLLILDELKEIRPAKAAAIQTLIDRLQADEST